MPDLLVGTIYGVTEVHVQYNHPLGSRFALSGNSSLLHHGALRSDEGSGEPVLGQAEELHERLQAAAALGGAIQWGSVNLDLMAGYVYLRPTPGFYRTHLRSQLNIRVSSKLKIILLLRSTRFRAGLYSCGNKHRFEITNPRVSAVTYPRGKEIHIAFFTNGAVIPF